MAKIKFVTLTKYEDTKKIILFFHLAKNYL